MADTLFNIFGDCHGPKQISRNVSRQQQLPNIENLGKLASTGPIKHNEAPKKLLMEPKKMNDTKKSFLANTGKTLQSTPLRQAFTPQRINLNNIVYDEDKNFDQQIKDLEFTRPKYDYFKDYLSMPQPEILHCRSPKTPPPLTNTHDFQNEDPLEDDLFKDDGSDAPCFEQDQFPDIFSDFF